MIWIIILLITYVIALIKIYRPTIDIIVLRDNKYRVLLWYNKHVSDSYNTKPIIVRKYIQLF